NDHTGSIGNADGIDAEDLAAYVAQKGGIKGYPRAKEIALTEFYHTNADIFIPAALECTVNEDNDSLIRAKFVVEGANGPTTPAAEENLMARGITVIPDILANSGGVTVSYFEWVQNKNSEIWELEKVDEELNRVMTRATHGVLDEMKARKTDPRTAAMALAVGRLEKIYMERGIFP
ncbi:MAG: glutamate dehydrogenase, partial [Candidatus Latescibacteria bacterium]|nr:glutamate dehydrogenase [Candidatus Latescibacterota bacterium]